MRPHIKKLAAATLLIAGIFGCASKGNKASKQDPPKIQENHFASVNGITLDRTIVHVLAQIDELQSLEEKVYARSLLGDPVLKKKLQAKILQYGSLETLQANLKVLRNL